MIRSLCALVGAALVVTGASCGDGGDAENGAPDVVEGVILHVDAASLAEIESFTIKNGDDTFEVFIDPAADYEFPPSHLSEHVLTGAPVRAEVEERDGKLYAVTLDDA